MSVDFTANATIISKGNTALSLTNKEVLQLVKIFTKELKLAKVPNRTGNDEMDSYICPTCGYELAMLDEYFEPRHCECCGQKIDWKNAYDRGKIIKKKE
jgi:DNA-directed RNA polymerase subunit RPC12/RpoP